MPYSNGIATLIDLSCKSSKWELWELWRQVSQKLDIVMKNLLGALDDSILIMSSLSSGHTGPSVSDDNFKDEEEEEEEEEYCQVVYQIDR